MIETLTRRLPERLGIRRRELERDAYLNRLNPEDEKNVRNFITGLNHLHATRSRKGNLALIAVGSSTDLAKLGQGNVNDIDLRVLNSESDNRDRFYFLQFLRMGIRDLLRESGYKFDEFDSTSVRRLINGKVRGKTTLLPWLDYSCGDPSFEVVTDGLPLHIFISSINSIPLEDHFREERKRNNTFSRLL